MGGRICISMSLSQEPTVVPACRRNFTWRWGTKVYSRDRMIYHVTCTCEAKSHMCYVRGHCHRSTTCLHCNYEAGATRIESRARLLISACNIASLDARKNPAVVSCQPLVYYGSSFSVQRLTSIYYRGT